MSIPVPVNSAPSRQVATARRKKINVRGRGQVDSPQGLIVQTMYVDPFIAEKRGKTEAPFYPHGSKEDFFALLGELCFTTTTSDSPTKAVLPNQPYREVFTTFNGLPYGAPVQFSGVINKEYNRENTDNSVTVCIAGVQTINNTGDEPIKNGDLVIWDEPLAEADSSGRVVSRIDAWGVSKNKFYAATRPLKLEDVNARFRALNLTLRKELERIAGKTAWLIDINEFKGDASKAEQIKTVMERLWQDNSIHRSNAPSDLLLYMTDAQRRQHEEAKHSMDPMRRFLGYILRSLGVDNNWFRPGAVDPAVLTHIANIRRSETESRLMSMSSNKRRRKGEPLVHAAADGSVATTQELKAINDNLPNPALYTDYVFQCAFDYYNDLQTRVLGRALMDAPPGRKFDILLNFHVR